MSKHENLNTKELKSFRSLIGQSGWVAGQSRQEITFQISELSSKIKHATIEDLIRAMKILMRIKSAPLELKSYGLGNLDNVKIIVYNDSSFGNLDNGGSQGEFKLFLANSFGNILPIL